MMYWLMYAKYMKVCLFALVKEVILAVERTDQNLCRVS
jgi:hypothetical protein